MGQFTFELDIPPGIVSDDTAFASKGHWAACDRIRFRNGKPETLPGYASLVSGFAGQEPQSFGVAAGKVIMGMQQHLYAINVSAATIASITPAVAPFSTLFWSITNWGASLVIASPNGGKVYESDGSAAATQVTNSPAASTRVLVTPQRQVLCFGTNEVVSGTFNARCIRGSDLEDRTSWTPSSSNNSFEDILDDPGSIVSAELIGPYVAVWTTASLFLGQFIGDPLQTYRWDRVDSGCGLRDGRAVTVLNGVAYWLGRDMNFYRWAPGELPVQMPCRIGQEFVENYGGLPFMVAVGRFNEIWLHYKDTRDGIAVGSTRYVVYSVGEGCWFNGTRQIHAGHSSAVLTDLLKSAGYDTGAYITVFSSTVYVEATGTPDDASYIQTADQYIDSGRRRVMVSRCEPDFEQQTGDVFLTLFVRDRPQSSAATKGPHTLTTSTTKKDFRASGNLAALKFSAAAGVKWRLGKPTFDCVTLGER